LQLVHDLIPNAALFGVLMDPANPGRLPQILYCMPRSTVGAKWCVTIKLRRFLNQSLERFVARQFSATMRFPSTVEIDKW